MHFPDGHGAEMNTFRAMQPVGDATRRRQTADQLTELIVTGELAAGTKLTETGLASALQISRGPLREAIRELVEAGLLVSQPYKGLFVRSASPRDLQEIYSLRTTLEQFAFKECWAKRTPAALDDLRGRELSLRQAVDDGIAPTAAIARELHLHSWCYELSGHALLLQSWERMKSNLHFYFSLHQQAHGRRGPRREAHDKYIELACGDDLQAMLSHLEEHMQQGLKTTLTFAEEG
ncbi:GntR family transcriptional regulator [Algicella marina]|uniref:GntR family transcriptional regulator n=1 Tax=Algicella marina TaxID=2683284 RepID=A0A6P1T4H5_9RHOB|nr:GntR family transcriptional regulator [Algicella marina]QHQ36907.1 GntR family transcriptional regulator [Algicella marina]